MPAPTPARVISLLLDSVKPVIFFARTFFQRVVGGASLLAECSGGERVRLGSAGHLRAARPNVFENAWATYLDV